MIRKHTPCPGLIDGLKCPYNAYQHKTCMIHTNSLIYLNKGFVSWIEKSNIVCDICTKNKNIIRYTCQKHYYCHECLVEASAFEECPICISLKDYVSN